MRFKGKNTYIVIMPIVFLLAIEKEGSKESIGVYKSEKEAKNAATEYIKIHYEDTKFKSKSNKGEDIRKVIFESDDVLITSNKVESYLTSNKSDKKVTKRPLSGFMIYSKENRARVVEENPKASFGDIARILGEEWKVAKGLNEAK